VNFLVKVFTLKNKLLRALQIGKRCRMTSEIL
jgi:hypothetical protein